VLGENLSGLLAWEDPSAPPLEKGIKAWEMAQLSLNGKHGRSKPTSAEVLSFWVRATRQRLPASLICML
jgi:hypothetical protein